MYEQKRRRLFTNMDKERINDLRVLLWKLMYDATSNKLFKCIRVGKTEPKLEKI